MIHAVHADAGDLPVIQQAVPTLPDCCCTQFYFMEPTGILFIQQQTIGKFVQTVIREYTA